VVVGFTGPNWFRVVRGVWESEWLDVALEAATPSDRRVRCSEPS
jgi:hypothetical protein